MFKVANISSLINDNQVLFNHMDGYHPYMLGHSYFKHPNYLVEKVWIRVTVLFPSFTDLTGSNVYVSMKIIPGIVRYWSWVFPVNVLWQWLI